MVRHLQHAYVQGLLCHHLVQLRILSFEILEPPGIRYLHATVLRLPAIKRRLRAVVLAAKIGHRKARLGFLQNANDLFFFESLTLHPVLLIVKP